jgi:hypothetical protein
MQTNELVRPAERGAVAALDRLPERENAAGRFTAPGASCFGRDQHELLRHRVLHVCLLEFHRRPVSCT